MTLTTRILVGLYTATLAGLALYAFYILILIVLYLRHCHERTPMPEPIPEAALPTVTVQIPLRNERYVVQRILRAVAAFDWPRDRLQIQVLDDSDDDTTAQAQAEVDRLQALGYKIELRHRPHTRGNKAGALAAGLAHARGEFVVIFDADFIPLPDFLRQTVPHLVRNPHLGLVQARWGHTNTTYSPLTRAQALALDAHFTVEHIARNRSGLLMNFNGTAGVWRKTAIFEAGGWQFDTIAEDLDLSYRAQLAGWQIRYLPDVTAPAELPPLIAAFKQQQYRWAKGATQALRKLAGPILHSPRLNFAQKVMALLHLSAYVTQPLFLLAILLTLPIAYYDPHMPAITAFLGAITAIPPLLYLLGQLALTPRWPRRILAYPLLMLLGIGITWSSTLAIVDGLLHWGGDFKRTPKFDLRGQRGTWQRTGYRIHLDLTTLGELCIGIYAALIIWVAIQTHEPALLPYSLIYLGGEILMIGGTAWQAILGKQVKKEEGGR
ncbi:MAG: glycosyltransferase [Anaerolineales bacterium]